MDLGNGKMAVTGEPHVLVVAGSDSSGGAGIVRDIETVAAFGLRTCLVVTAVTVQTHDSAGEIALMKPAQIEAQMRAAFASNDVRAIKIGMLGTSAAVQAVASVLRERRGIPAVLDPVLASTSGKALLEPGAETALKSELMPLCTLVTPNLDELAMLSGIGRSNGAETTRLQAEALFRAGCRAILAKGGHGTGDLATDILYRTGEPTLPFNTQRVNGTVRGTGCMLSSAVAAGLARGNSLTASIAIAKQYVHEAISNAAATKGICC